MNKVRSVSVSSLFPNLLTIKFGVVFTFDHTSFEKKNKKPYIDEHKV